MVVSPKHMLCPEMSSVTIGKSIRTSMKFEETYERPHSYSLKPSLAPVSVTSSFSSSRCSIVSDTSDGSYFQDGSNSFFRCSSISPSENMRAISTNSCASSPASCSRNAIPLSNLWPANYDRCNTLVTTEEHAGPCSCLSLSPQALPPRSDSFFSRDQRPSTTCRNGSKTEFDRWSKPLPCPTPQPACFCEDASPIPNRGAQYRYDLATWAMFHRISGARRNCISDFQNREDASGELKHPQQYSQTNQKIYIYDSSDEIESFSSSNIPIDTICDDEEIFEMDD